MIKHRGDDQRPIQDGRDQDGVLELGQLVAEPAVWGIPEESLAGQAQGFGTGAWSGIGGQGFGREGDEGSEDLKVGGEEEDEEEDEEEERDREEEGLVPLASLSPSSSVHC